jgi:hypothetical protein
MTPLGDLRRADSRSEPRSCLRIPQCFRARSGTLRAWSDGGDDLHHSAAGSATEGSTPIVSAPVPVHAGVVNERADTLHKPGIDFGEVCGAVGRGIRLSRVGRHRWRSGRHALPAMAATVSSHSASTDTRRGRCWPSRSDGATRRRRFFR